MIKTNELAGLKLFCKTQIDTYENGVLYAIVENNIIIWQLSSDHIDLPGFSQGQRINYEIVTRAIRSKQTTSEMSFDENTHKNLNITAVPIIEDEDQTCQSVFITVTAHIHPIQSAFKYFAPIITDMFTEGAFISLTDATQIIDVQRSDKYNIESVEPGFDITGQEGIMNVLQTGKQLRADDDSLAYGPPVRVLTSPYFGHDKNTPIGVMNIIRPKQSELSLRDMSANLEKQLSEVSTTIQDLASSSSSIYSNGQELNTEIEEITTLADQIFEISKLIESLANATKMLGLNASIEAARAGAAGRGFGVVANEINKLSEESNSTVPRIKKLTDDIKEKVETAKHKSQGSLTASMEQVAGTQEITATIEEIQAVSVELANIASTI